jgi:O-acetyl-ADP-ribose deacetylase (regulator of RNase III)
MRLRVPAAPTPSKRRSPACARAAKKATRRQGACGASVGRAVVEAAAAFGAGDRARAAGLLDPVMPMMTSIGGSDAQDDLFRQTYLRSLQAARRSADAAAYFERITASKTPTPLDRALAG